MRINLFSSPIIIDECSNFLEKKSDLLDFCYKQKESYDSVQYSNRLSAWQSPPLEPDDSFDLFDEDLIRILAEYKIQKDLMVKYLWININSKNGYNNLHHHGVLTPLSVILYVQVPEGSGDLVFHSPVHLTGCSFYTQVSPEFHGENLTMPEYRITPKEGMIVVFPSYLWHLVESNNSNCDRISISFNVMTV